jgi:hypothetical protein
MGPWDIRIEHLKHNPDITLENLFEKKQAIVCKSNNWRFMGTTEKALIPDNLQQHQSEAEWELATLRVQLGLAPPIPEHEDPVRDFTNARDAFPKRKQMTTQEAQIAGVEWRAQAWEDWENGAKEKHPTRAEARRIAEDGSFKRFIQEDLNPYWEVFKNCDFDAQEGLTEMGWQLERSKVRSIIHSPGTIFGPKKVADAKDIERRRVVAEHAKVQYWLLKSTQLILDAINWRITDKRLTETEYELSGIEIDDARIWIEREKKKTLRKCIERSAENVEPYSPERPEPHIGLTPSGRSVLAAIERGFNLEGNSVEDLDEEHQSEEKPREIEETVDLYYPCEKTTPDLIEAEMEQVWEQCPESQVCKTCLSIRRYVYTNTMPKLEDKKKQEMLEETDALRDRNDWILDPKHVYRRSVLKRKMPQWPESNDRMEAWYRPIWNPPALSRGWKPPVSENDIWAFPKSEFTDGEEIAKEFKEFMTDKKIIGQNLR